MLEKVLLFYYGDKNQPYYAWAKKITKIEDPKKTLYKKHRENNEHKLYGVEVYGTNTVIMKDKYLLYQKESMSNAQEFAIELTLEEKLLYRKTCKNISKRKST